MALHLCLKLLPSLVAVDCSSPRVVLPLPWTIVRLPLCWRSYPKRPPLPHQEASAQAQHHAVLSILTAEVALAWQGSLH